MNTGRGRVAAPPTFSSPGERDIVNLDQIKNAIRSALEALEDTHIYPRVRAGGALEFLRQIRRDDLPEGLRARFDALLASFGSVPQNLTDDQVARCAQLTRELATALEAPAEIRRPIPPEAKPASPSENPEDDRAAADN
jgi:hypothetical protein